MSVATDPCGVELMSDEVKAAHEAYVKRYYTQFPQSPVAKWCDCGCDTGFHSYPGDGECSCGMHKHHVHGLCGHVTQVG